MSDLISEMLPRLQAHRLPGLDFGDRFIYPDYGDGSSSGRSVLNLPSSICRLLGAPEFGAGALDPAILNPLGEGVRRLILILMDALSLHRFQRWIANGTAQVWWRLAQDSLLAPLTSITPSTTSAALTSLWTGRSTAEHGIAGYELWLKEYGVVTNMILHSPITYQNDAGSLTHAGFQPQTFLNLPTLGTHLAEQGVKTYAFQHSSIMQSGLSQMFFRDVKTLAFSTAADLWVNVRHLLENHPNERLYAWVYWSELDHLSHLYGPDDERSAAEFASFSTIFERLLLYQLSTAARKDTLVILTADHGQISTRKDAHYDLRNHPDLVRRLHILPTGENRFMYLFVRPGQGEAVREYLERTWPGQFTLVDPGFAVNAGLFGPGEPHPRLMDRLGDLLVIARDHAYLWWAEKENPLLGRHGGLSADEMLVPFLAVRL
jgi:hypothetical protein